MRSVILLYSAMVLIKRWKAPRVTEKGEHILNEEEVYTKVEACSDAVLFCTILMSYALGGFLAFYLGPRSIRKRFDG